MIILCAVGVKLMIVHRRNVTSCCLRDLVSVQRAFLQLVVTTLSVMHVFLDTLVTSVTG